MQIPLEGLGDCNKDAHISRGTNASSTFLLQIPYPQHVTDSAPSQQVLYIYGES